MEDFELNNGMKIPVIGSGTNTFGKVGKDYAGAINGDTTELLSAIKQGYRHFDTAIAYRNESVVGKALQESGLDRENFFIVSKLPGKPEYTKNEDAVQNGINQSLKALRTKTIDLYLIHHPWDNLAEIAEVWRVLEDNVDKGVLKAIGVSNFNEEQLGYLLDHSRIKPAVNQVESHPGHWNDDIIAYAKQNKVVPEAWGPLTQVNTDAQKKLGQIGDQYHKNRAQVILRYQFERGVITIPKSHNPKHQAENLDIFDFKLNDQDKKVIQSL